MDFPTTLAIVAIVAAVSYIVGSGLANANAPKTVPTLPPLKLGLAEAENIVAALNAKGVGVNKDALVTSVVTAEAIGVRVTLAEEGAEAIKASLARAEAARNEAAIIETQSAQEIRRMERQIEQLHRMINKEKQDTVDTLALELEDENAATARATQLANLLDAFAVNKA